MITLGGGLGVVALEEALLPLELLLDLITAEDPETAGENDFCAGFDGGLPDDVRFKEFGSELRKDFSLAMASWAGVGLLAVVVPILFGFVDWSSFLADATADALTLGNLVNDVAGFLEVGLLDFPTSFWMETVTPGANCRISDFLEAAAFDGVTLLITKDPLAPTEPELFEEVLGEPLGRVVLDKLTDGDKFRGEAEAPADFFWLANDNLDFGCTDVEGLVEEDVKLIGVTFEAVIETEGDLVDWTLLTDEEVALVADGLEGDEFALLEVPELELDFLSAFDTDIVLGKEFSNEV